MHLTKRMIDAAAYRGQDNARDVRWDDDPHGLGLRIYPSGRKSFVVAYRNANGVKRMAALGDFGVMTLEDARRAARRMLVQVDDAKIDPLAEKRRQRLEGKTGTVAALFRAYVEARRTDRHRPMKRPADVLWYGDKYIFPTFGSRPWRDVRRSEVREWHASIRSPYIANRALQALRAAFYWRLWQEDDSAGNRRRESDTRNPAAGIRLRTETVRRARIEIADIPKLDAAIDASTTDPYLQTIFRFILATGCRRTEALTLRWADVQLSDAPAATFRDVKAGGAHAVALSPYAVRLLRDLRRIEGNPYVFPGRTAGTHLTAINKAWERIRKRAGLEGFRIHDLRRSFGSWLGDAGFTSKQIGAALGHRSDITSRVYMQLGDQSKRAAADAVGRILEHHGESADVTPFKRPA